MGEDGAWDGYISSSFWSVRFDISAQHCAVILQSSRIIICTSCPTCQGDTLRWMELQSVHRLTQKGAFLLRVARMFFSSLTCCTWPFFNMSLHVRKHELQQCWNEERKRYRTQYELDDYVLARSNLHQTCSVIGGRKYRLLMIFIAYTFPFSLCWTSWTRP